MRKTAGILLVTTGAVLVTAALLLFCYNQRESQRAGQASEHLLNQLEAVLETQDGEKTEETEPTLDPELPVVTIDGYDYVGYLEVPELELKLPVQATWSYPQLQISPCREVGSSRTDDLIIAAHNYATHFGKLKKLEPGAEVKFTDMDGIENRYTVAENYTLDPMKVETVYNSGYALVLYTCTPGGEYRQVVMCQRVEEAVRP